MGHHVNEDGLFQSDKHPDLPPNRVRINIERPTSWPAIHALVEAYAPYDDEFASDLDEVLKRIKAEAPIGEIPDDLTVMNAAENEGMLRAAAYALGALGVDEQIVTRLVAATRHLSTRHGFSLTDVLGAAKVGVREGAASTKGSA